MLIASGPIGGAPTGSQPGARVSSALESPYGPAKVNSSWLESPYGTLYARQNLDHPYRDSPIASTMLQPFAFTMDARLESSWTLMDKVGGQSVQGWTSTVTVASQCAQKYDLLARDPVASAFGQIWNLSDERAIRLSGTLVRAFHLGELV